MKTINNFRDFGGYATLDGQRLRTGHLYRSGILDDARRDELHLLPAIGLRTIVDLRTPGEKKKELPTIAGARRIDQRHGGLTAYLAKCGITLHKIETLRRLLLE